MENASRLKDPLKPFLQISSFTFSHFLIDADETTANIRYFGSISALKVFPDWRLIEHE